MRVSLEDFEASCLQCQRCDLAKERHHVVISRGHPSARLMVIGEAPGADEDAQGRPFVGRSGRLLDACLADVGLVHSYTQLEQVDVGVTVFVQNLEVIVVNRMCNH